MFHGINVEEINFDEATGKPRNISALIFALPYFPIRYFSMKLNIVIGQSDYSLSKEKGRKRRGGTAVKKTSPRFHWFNIYIGEWYSHLIRHGRHNKMTGRASTAGEFFPDIGHFIMEYFAQLLFPNIAKRFPRHRLRFPPFRVP